MVALNKLFKRRARAPRGAPTPCHDKKILHVGQMIYFCKEGFENDFILGQIIEYDPTDNRNPFCVKYTDKYGDIDFRWPQLKNIFILDNFD